MATPFCYNPAQRMTSHDHTPSRSIDAAGWTFYARYYAWRFS